MADMSPIDHLLAGFKDFRARYYEHRPELFEALKTGQTPKVMVIGGADSRSDPAILTQSEPGELFIVRNVANIVPPYQPDQPEQYYHGTSAALEFAVRDLRVEHIVILGHSQCSGIRALVASMDKPMTDRDFIAPWVSIVRSACEHHSPGARDANGNQDLSRVEQAAIQISMNNLMTYPWIRSRVLEDKDLKLYGWWFDLQAGDLWTFDPEVKAFSHDE